MFVPIKKLPPTLWKDGLYLVPELLQKAYVSELKESGLFEMAKQQPEHRKIYGGKTLEETKEHFIYRFSASVARLQNVLLDVHSAFGNWPFEINQTLSSHRISMLDIPCGTGAGGLSVLTTIYELRVAGIVPCLPLSVDVLGGDFSSEASRIYRKQFEKLTDAFASVGMNCVLDTVLWDATDLASTNELCMLWERRSIPAHHKFVLITNFSGDGKGIINEISESLRHVCVRAASANSLLLWVEPGDKGGVAFLSKMSEKIRSFFGNQPDPDYQPPSSEAKWWHDVNGCELPTRTAVHKYLRPQ